VDYLDKTHGYFTRDQVFFIRGPSLNGYEGLPAIRQAREAIGLSKALERQQAKLAGNGGKPSGVLSFAQPLKPETKEKLRETWQARFGANGEGGIAILDGDAKFHSMTMTSVDAQYIETRRLQIEEIGRAFRVQPIMLMQADKAATFASAEQMFRNHVIHTLGPWIARFEEAVNRDILGNETGVRVDLDERNLLRGDFKDQAEYYAKALGAGGTPAWMTQNEIRAEVGLNPVDNDSANSLSAGAMNPGAAPEGVEDGV
jgi:HK97 family phage portal protein